ncbi:kyphoscoliosis peptidase-like isoform X2 [Mercenaria mercenaria]|nr:kyphoscoliosis peptidase-like isoform X2 [Mercenaria mercenaria]
MCSSLNIPCRIIQGETKDFTSYRHETYRAEWCAFMCNDDWHLVDLDGILSATTYHETEGRIVLESEGEAILEHQEQKEGQLLVVFNDFWFCTKPNKIISFDFPDERKWLLLDSPVSSDEFESMLFTYVEFHILGLQFLTECSSKLLAKDGRCKISIKADPSVLRSKCFPYTLSLIEGTGDISETKAEDLPLLVTYAPGIDMLSFNIRFPVSGEYVFEVSVKDLDDDDIVCHCFDVVIVCEEADPNCRKLPIDAGIVGFGYGHAAKEAGLKNPSKASPTVNVNPQTDGLTHPKTLTFQIENDHIDTIEYGSDIIADNDINAFSETHVDADKGKLTVVANVKTEGEYALSITAKPKQSGDNPETVLNYLLTTNKNEDDVEQEQLMKKRKLDLILESKMEDRITTKKVLTKKIDAIEKELLELRKMVEDGIDTTLNAASGDHVYEGDRCSQSKNEDAVDSSAVLAAGENDDNATATSLLAEEAGTVSTSKLAKKSKMCHLM